MSRVGKFFKVSALLFFGGILSCIIYGLMMLPQMLHVSFGVKILLYFVSGLCGIGIYALWQRLIERHSPADLNLRKAPAEIGKGLALGFGLFTTVTLVFAITGLYRVGSVQFNWKELLETLAVFFIVGCGEEYIFRGIFFRIFDKYCGTWVALLVSALIFGFAHIGNDNATVWSAVAIAIEAGILLGLAYKASGSLWYPIAIHWAWNFTQGKVYGFPVSGGQVRDSIITPVVSGPEFLTGGAFGAEASVITVALGIAISLTFIAKIKAKKVNDTDIQK